jgi:spore coat polysaccharide biosynthesis predicted glycosyltransferase SpsG
MSRLVMAYASGSKAIGVGHVTRQLDLLRAFQRVGDQRVLLLTHDDPAVRMLVESSPVPCQYMQKGQRGQDVAAMIRLAVKQHAPDVFVLDDLDLDLDETLPSFLMDAVACYLAITDDTYPRKPVCHICANGNPNQRTEWYRDADGEWLLGPSYFVLPEAVAAARNHIRPLAKHPKRLLVSLGGSDHNDLLCGIADHVSFFPRELEILLVSGPGSGLEDRIAATVKKHAAGNVKVVPFIAEFSSALIHADIALTAGGNTLFQRLALGTPGVTICQLDRQNEIASSYEQLGCNVNLGMGVDVQPNDVVSAIVDLMDDHDRRMKQREVGMHLVDGRGAERVVARVSERFFDVGTSAPSSIEGHQ